MRRIAFGLLISAIMSAAPLRATETTPVKAPADADPDTLPVLQHRDLVSGWTEEQRLELGQREGVWIAPGLVADREAGTIRILAEATGLTVEHPIEFLLIADTSGHDYEAIAVSYARPSAIHEALEFLGTSPGAPYNPGQFRFAPKGPLVQATFAWQDEDGAEHNWPAGKLIQDIRTGDSLGAEGFLFTGSMILEEDGDPFYAADYFDPQSIISIYNEPGTVLDRPKVVRQSDVYGLLQVYPDRQPAVGQLLEVLFKPVPGAGSKDVELVVQTGTEDQPVSLTAMDGDGESLHTGHRLADVLGALEEIRQAGRTPYVALSVAGEVPLQEVRDLFRLLDSFEDAEELYVEPPPSGHPFYRAFLPVEAHRQRAMRPSQVLELHLVATDGDWAGEVIHVRDVRSRREDPFEEESIAYAVPSPADLAPVLAEIAHRLPVLLVFAPSHMRYEELLDWIGPVLSTHSTMYVFLEEAAEETAQD